METWEIVAYGLGALLVAILILWFFNYDGEKPEDVDFK
jgi:hypothetical protein